MGRDEAGWRELLGSSNYIRINDLVIRGWTSSRERTPRHGREASPGLATSFSQQHHGERVEETWSGYEKEGKGHWKECQRYWPDSLGSAWLSLGRVGHAGAARRGGANSPVWRLAFGLSGLADERKSDPSRFDSILIRCI